MRDAGQTLGGHARDKWNVRCTWKREGKQKTRTNLDVPGSSRISTGTNKHVIQVTSRSQTAVKLLNQCLDSAPPSLLFNPYWTPGVGDGQGGLACCGLWGRKELDTTEWLNWTDASTLYSSQCFSSQRPNILLMLNSSSLNLKAMMLSFKEALEPSSSCILRGCLWMDTLSSTPSHIMTTFRHDALCEVPHLWSPFLLRHCLSNSISSRFYPLRMQLQ